MNYRKYVWRLCLWAVLIGLMPDVLEAQSPWTTHAMEQLPVSYKGRIRPLEAYARLWLQDLYGAEEIAPDQLRLFHLSSPSALELIWKIHFLGHAPWNDAPLFEVNDLKLKQALQLPLRESRFSYSLLNQAIYKDQATNSAFLKPLLIEQFWSAYHSPVNRSKNQKQELASLAPGLWLLLKDNKLIVVESVHYAPWNFFEPGTMLVEDVGRFDFAANKKLSEEVLKLLLAVKQYRQTAGGHQISESDLSKTIEKMQHQGGSPEKIAETIEERFPIAERVQGADSMLAMLPSKKGGGVWLPLKALKLKFFNPNSGKLELIPNFTLYPEALFRDLQRTYIDLERAVLIQERDQIPLLSEKLTTLLSQGYQAIAGTLVLEAAGKVVTYPNSLKLKIEVLYYQFPGNLMIIFFYAISVLLFTLSFFFKKELFTKLGVGSFLLAFVFHTGLLVIRSYILGRPPVSNMFETVVYVPWIASLVSLILYMKLEYRLLLISSSLIASILLLLLQATALHHELENVQPVLDSQYWLIIHVLLVVGSYGVFALAAMLGHIYLFCSIRKTKETTAMRFLAAAILQALYLGVFMLVPGTILGGVWAAESWGRFWDWDPKESWAFISTCLYLIWIHLYRYQYISSFGLAVGAVFGFLAISFTWYGVNYILGSGLHSYGFGSGGELYYYLFVVAELLFLSYALQDYRSSKRNLRA